MRVVVTVGGDAAGVAVVEQLGREPGVAEVVAVAPDAPRPPAAKVRWIEAELATAELGPVFECADAVVHLAVGSESRRVLAAVAATGVPALVHLLPSSTEPRDRARVELALDEFEAECPRVRVVRLPRAGLGAARIGELISAAGTPR